MWQVSGGAQTPATAAPALPFAGRDLGQTPEACRPLPRMKGSHSLLLQLTVMREINLFLWPVGYPNGPSTQDAHSLTTNPPASSSPGPNGSGPGKGC